MSGDCEAGSERDQLIARARALVPKLREYAQRCETQRRLPDEVAADIAASAITRVCQPRRFGGMEQDFETLSELMIELSHGDGSQGWVANVYAEHAYWIALFPEAAQQDVWGANPAAFVSSSISHVGNDVQRTADGCIVSGRWPFVSGVHHSDWTVIGELIPEPGGDARYHFLLVPAADRKVIDDWHTMGMAGTGSMSIALDRAFVPNHRMLANSEVAAGTSPGARIHANPIYRMPVFGFSSLGLASVPVGVAEAMTNDFAEFVAARIARSIKPSTIASLQSRLTEASAEARAARLLVLDAARANMTKLRAGEVLDQGDAARTARNGAYACVLARRAVSRLFEATGGQGIRLGQPMQRAFRDVQAGAAHAALNWDLATTKFGRLMTGQPAEPPPF